MGASRSSGTRPLARAGIGHSGGGVAVANSTSGRAASGSTHVVSMSRALTWGYIAPLNRCTANISSTAPEKRR